MISDFKKHEIIIEIIGKIEKTVLMISDGSEAKEVMNLILDIFLKSMVLPMSVVLHSFPDDSELDEYIEIIINNFSAYLKIFIEKCIKDMKDNDKNKIILN